MTEVDSGLPFPSKTQDAVVARLRGLLGDEIFNDVPPIFVSAGYCLMEAARCYDALAFSASCVMSRASLEAGLLAFSASKRTMKGWRPIKPKLTEKGRLSHWQFEYWYTRARKRARFTSENRKDIRRVKRDGDVAAHWAQRTTAELWVQSDRLEELRKRRGRERRGRKPIVRVRGLLSSIEAYRNLMAAADILALLVRRKSPAGAQRPSNLRQSNLEKPEHPI